MSGTKLLQFEHSRLLIATLKIHLGFLQTHHVTIIVIKTTTMTIKKVSRSNTQSITTSQRQAYIRPGRPGNIEVNGIVLVKTHWS